MTLTEIADKARGLYRIRGHMPVTVALFIDAVAEIDRRLRLVEPCRGSLGAHHQWRVRGADGSYLCLGADLTAPGVHTVCDGCGLEWPR